MYYLTALSISKNITDLSLGLYKGFIYAIFTSLHGSYYVKIEFFLLCMEARIELLSTDITLQTAFQILFKLVQGSHFR